MKRLFFSLFIWLIIIFILQGCTSKNVSNKLLKENLVNDTQSISVGFSVSPGFTSFGTIDNVDDLHIIVQSFKDIEYIPDHKDEAYFRPIDYQLTATLKDSSQIIVLVNENETRISKAGDDVNDDKKYEYYESRSLYSTLKYITEKSMFN